VGVPLGAWAAWRANSWTDRMLMSVTMLGVVLPGFVVGPVLALLFGIYWPIFRIAGYEPWNPSFLVLLLDRLPAWWDALRRARSEAGTSAVDAVSVAGQQHGLVVLVHGQHHDAHLGVATGDEAGRLDAVEVRHLDVHHHHVGGRRVDHVEGLAIGLGVHRHRLDVELSASPNDPDGYFTAVCNQYFANFPHTLRVQGLKSKVQSLLARRNPTLDLGLWTLDLFFYPKQRLAVFDGLAVFDIDLYDLA